MLMIESFIRTDAKDDCILVEEFIDSEEASLSKVVTNADDNIYAWKLGEDLSAEQSGALLSRYSRTSLTGRRLFLKEFLPNKSRGKEFFESWLVDYGDDSIQEMAGGMPMSCEFISNIAAKEIEDSRFGSYIEKSTRYVPFDMKLKNGDYMFYKDRDILSSRFGDEYLELMRSLFDSYAKNMDKMTAFIRESNPFEEQKFSVRSTTVTSQEMSSSMEERLGVTINDLQKSYDNATKANALDFMRDYLPMSLLTHVGISMNARSYESAITKLLASPLSECNFIGSRMHRELTKVVPSLLKRINDSHGAYGREFISNSRDNSILAVAGLSERIQPDNDRELVRLIDYTGMGSKDPDMAASIKLASFIVYRFGKGFSLSQSIAIADSMSQAERESVISSYVCVRKNRRHKPGRAFENISLTLDFCSRIGIYRDLQRHRVGTQERQMFTVKHGYNMRDQFKDIGIEDDYKSKMEQVISLYNRISEAMPYQAQYVVTFGFNIRWYYSLNARQMFHFCELRTGMGGHPDYRDLAQKVYLAASKVLPSVTKYMNFMNMEPKQMGRLESEIRIAQKKRDAQKKFETRQ